VRKYPACSASLSVGSKTVPSFALLDTGADDCIFSDDLARLLGIDLTNAPIGTASPVGGPSISYRYAHVALRLSDGIEHCEWLAIVGFVAGRRSWGLLGRAGCLPYFDATFRGSHEDAILLPNTTFPGIYHRP
jgi:hypothetical protein